MIELCIFDLDGTIADTLEDLAVSVNFSLEKNGYPTHDTDSYRTFAGDGVVKLLERASGCTDSDVISKIKKDFDEYYALNSTNHTKPFDGCREVLEKLVSMGKKIAVFSNKSDEFVRGILDAIYPGIDFVFAIGKQTDFPLKPCPDAMLREISKLGISVENCLYIGDSNVDMHTARNAGMTSCGVTWGFRTAEELKEAGADFVVELPLEIVRLACIG